MADNPTIIYADAICTELVGLIESPHRGKVRIEALHRAIGLAAQVFEDEVWNLMTSLNIDFATGPTLDIIGGWEAWPRNGLNDDDYRQTIKAAAIANVSDGTPEAMVAIMKAAFGTDLVEWQETESPMTQHVQAFVELDYDDRFRRRVREVMERGKSGGTKLMLTQAIVGDAFIFDERGFDAGAFGIAL